MKKFLFFFLRALSTLIVPGIFVVATLFALNQTFAIGLVILFSSIIVQILLSGSDKYHYRYNFDRLRSLSLQVDDEYEFIEEISNLTFNLSKFVTVFGALELIRINYPPVNLLGNLGRAIIISLISIGLFIMIFTERRSWYRVIRNSLVLILIILMFALFYVYFGTLLVLWLFAFFLLSTGLFNSYKEFESKLGFSESNFPSTTSIIFFVTIILSIIVQYWRGISNFFVKLNVRIWGLSLWLWLLILVVLIFIYFFIMKVVGMIRSEKEAEARFAREREERLRRKMVEEEEALRQKSLAEEEEIKKMQAVNTIVASLKEGSFPQGSTGLKDLIYLARNFRYIRADSYTKPLIEEIKWDKFFQISLLKKQIIWNPGLESVLYFLSELYSESYDDEELSLIISSLENLCKVISEFSEFTGFSALSKLLEKIFSGQELLAQVVAGDTDKE